MPDVVLLSVVPTGDTEVVVRTGGPVFPAEDMVSADQSTISGNGTWLHKLHAGGSAGGSVLASLSYVASGAEDIDGFPIAFPDVGTIEYAVNLTLFNSDDTNFYQVKTSAKATNHIMVQATDTLTAGDVIDVVIVKHS